MGFFYFYVIFIIKKIMAKIVRLTESDLTRLVRRVIKESKYFKHDKMRDWSDEDDFTMNSDDIENFDSDYDEEEFDDYDTFVGKYPRGKHSFEDGGSLWGGKEKFDKYKNTFGPLKVRTRRSMD